MIGNQFTTAKSLEQNLNVRLTAELRMRVIDAAMKHKLTKADVVRDALEHYLPILEGFTTETEK